jgi:hypothetical protein
MKLALTSLLKAPLFLAALLTHGSVSAEDNVLLLQLRPGGGMTVWHTEGDSQITDDEALNLEASAQPAGSAELPTAAGPARSYETPDGVLIRLPAAAKDNALLIDRDNCGHIKLWHAAGATHLSDDQLTDIFMSALPEGGKRLTIGDRHVKAYITKLGVTASLWPVRKKN